MKTILKQCMYIHYIVTEITNSLLSPGEQQNTSKYKFPLMYRNGLPNGSFS